MTTLSTTDLMIELVSSTHEIALTAEGEPFAVARGSSVVVPIGRSNGPFHDRVLVDYRQEYGIVPPMSSVREAIGYLVARARDSPSRDVFLRVGSERGKIVIDLGRKDQAVLVVTPDSWSIEATSPLLFQRNKLIGEMPIPDRSGQLEDVRECFSHLPDQAFDVVLGWLVTFFIPRYAQPVLYLAGTAGSGKTLLAKRIKQLVDPSPVLIQGEPANDEQWVRLLASSQAIGLDNLSKIDQRVSDRLCRAVTGDGQVKRQLYTDVDLIVTFYRRAIILTGIDLGQLENDLIDRLIAVRLPRIDGADLRSEEQLITELDAVRPKVLGALLNLLVEVLAKLPDIQLDQTPRMADFGRVLAALDSILGTGRQHFDAYLSNRDELVGDAIEGDAVAQLVLRLMEGRATWRGSNSVLLTQLRARATTESPDLPSHPRGLRSRLERAAPILAQVGIEIEFPSGTGSSRTRRVITIRQRESQDNRSAETPSTSAGNDAADEVSEAA